MSDPLSRTATSGGDPPALGSVCTLPRVVFGGSDQVGMSFNEKLLCVISIFGVVCF